MPVKYNQFEMEKKERTLKIKEKRQSSSQKDEMAGGCGSSQDCVKKIKQIMGTTTYMLSMSILTIYTIFAIDIDKGFFNLGASLFFSTIHVVSMAIFTFQIVLTSIIEKDYLLQFYFWIDIFSTLMMALELIWIQDLMNSTDNIQIAISFARVSKASRFSKIGARSTKIMKLIRLIKLMKLFRNQQNENKGELKGQNHIQQNIENENEMGEKLQQENSSNGTLSSQNKFCKRYFERPNVNPIEQEKIEMQWQQLSEKQRNKFEIKPKQQSGKGTKVGEILKYQIQKNIVIMVMGLIMIVPLLSASTWFNKTGDMEPSTQSYLQTVQNNTNEVFFSSWLNSFLEVSLNSSRPLVKFQYASFSFPTQQHQLSSNFTSIDELRSSEKTVLEDDSFFICYSKKHQTQITSWINISRSLLIIFLLLLTSIMFVKDLEVYALNPLQKMSTTVSKIQQNPFSVLQNDGQENEQEFLVQIKEQEELQLETNILENFFIKITSFLALGVGETPLKPISNSPQKNEERINILSELNCIKVEGIFVCIQLSNIEQLVYHLEDKASSFINTMMQIFHETVIENCGYVFHQDEQYSVVCWKFLRQGQKETQKSIQDKFQQRKNAQLAFLSYLRFAEKISQSQIIKKYEQEHQFLPNVSEAAKFNIGFHSGIAYCGAIGSEFKLSLKAMGPDISIVKSLCRGARKYKTENLMSENYVRMAPFLSSLCRKIEQFQFIESQKIGKIQTYSLLSCSGLRAMVKLQTTQPLEENQDINDQIQRKKIKRMFKLREESRKNYMKNKTQDSVQLSKNFLKKYPNMEEYVELWKESCTYFEQGQWGNAKIGFQNSKQCNVVSNDVITEVRLVEIGNREEPPANWKKAKKFSLFL